MFELCAATIAGWVRQAGIDGGERRDGPPQLEREELARLRKEHRQLRMERDILSKAAALTGESRRKGTRATIRDDRGWPASDLVDRNFRAGEANQLWVADITYVPTWAGFIYLSVVLDTWSRRIVGWYNPSRRHSALGYESPITFGRSAQKQLQFTTG